MRRRGRIEFKYYILLGNIRENSEEEEADQDIFHVFLLGGERRRGAD